MARRKQSAPELIAQTLHAALAASKPRTRKYAYAEGTPQTRVRRTAIDGQPTQLVATTPAGGGMVRNVAESVITDADYREQARRSARAQGKTPQQVMAEGTGFSLAFVLERWPEEHLPANQAGNHHELVADAERASADADEYPPSPLTVTYADLETVEEALDCLDLSRRDSSGGCWYCGQPGNPADPADHKPTCPWARLDGIRYRIGEALEAGREAAIPTQDGQPIYRGPINPYEYPGAAESALANVPDDDELDPETVLCGGCGYALAWCQCAHADLADVPF